MRGVLEGAHDGIVSFTSDGRIQYANPAMHWIFGASTGELEGLQLHRLRIPGLQTRDQLRDLVAQTLRRQRWRVLTGEGKRFDDASFPMEASVACDVTATSRSYVAIVRDLTDQEQVLSRLRVSEEKYRRLFDSAPMAIVTWRLDLTALEWNDCASELFGWIVRGNHSSPSKGVELATIIPDRLSSGPVRDAVRAVAVHRSELSVDQVCITRGGAERRCRWYLAPLTDSDGKVWAITTLVLDLSPQDEAAARMQALRQQLARVEEAERSRIARELHDDLSQRLAAVAIGMQVQEEAVQGTGDAALIAGFRELRLDVDAVATELHTLSRRLHPTVLDDLGLIRALRSECARRGRLAELQISFEGSLSHDEPHVNVGIALFRVLQEALGNAIRHSRARSVRVTLFDSGEGLELTIEDDGDGFFLSRSTERNGGHSGGLGIASMRERMQLVGGDLRVSTLLGTGTVIRASVSREEVDSHASNDAKLLPTS
ncbi:MAG: PAS domain S-box protein [Planctomycetota bacterium]